MPALPPCPSACSYFGAVADADSTTAIAVGSLFEHQVSCRCQYVATAQADSCLPQLKLGAGPMNGAELSSLATPLFSPTTRPTTSHFCHFTQELVQWAVNATDVAPGPVSIAIVDGNPPNVKPGTVEWESNLFCQWGCKEGGEH